MKKLLLIILPVLFFTVTMQAQKTWNFSDEGTWPLNDGIGLDPVIIDNLALYPHSSNTNMGQVDGSSVDFGDGFVSTNRLKTNGSGGADPTSGQYTPTVRYLKFAVTGPCDITVWARSGGSSERTLYVTDGSGVLASQTATDSSTPYIVSSSYPGGAGNIYIFGSNNFSLYKIEVSANVGTTTLSLNKFAANVSTNVRAVGNRIYVSDVKLDTEINIYSMTGALVKSLKTSNDTDFSFKSGLYIATVKTAEGQKSVKLLTK
ncbi:T9SS type A sorting domain-containing protein [Tamlana flava]|uniref:T9SS type A sorting domain-containing protein n=1 Tax=Tamlana flava TaxID=3158572 RepID=UPI00351B6D11